MRWGRKGKEEVERETYYRFNQFWFAWFPVKATDNRGGKSWVWLEDVKVKHVPNHYTDVYGFVCHDVRYEYETLIGNK